MVAAADLPDLITLNILNRFRDASVFQLVSLASVCSGWRAFVKELHASHLTLETTLAFKENTTWTGAGHFWSLTVPQKSTFYEAATKLIGKHTNVRCSGAAISDRTILNLANSSVEFLILEDCVNVTDRSLSILLLSATKLKALHLKNMPGICGAFWPALLLQGKQLQHLTLKNLGDPEGHLPMEAYFSSNSLPALKSLTLESVKLDKGRDSFFRSFPQLKYLSLDSCSSCIWAATSHCRQLEEVVLIVDSSVDLDDSLAALISAPALRTLELSPTTFKLTPSQMRLAGVLNLTELRLESFAFKQQPLNRIAICHVDNDGVKVLVDTICQRKLHQSGCQPFRLSLCGAASITHDAVGALLRLPILSGLTLDGCIRISSLDKMRLIAKVRVGRELLDGKSWQKAFQGDMAISTVCRSI